MNGLYHHRPCSWSWPYDTSLQWQLHRGTGPAKSVARVYHLWLWIYVSVGRWLGWWLGWQRDPENKTMRQRRWASSRKSLRALCFFATAEAPSGYVIGDWRPSARESMPLFRSRKGEGQNALSIRNSEFHSDCARNQCSTLCHCPLGLTSHICSMGP